MSVHPMQPGIRKILNKTLKVVAWIIGSVILLLIAIALLIQIPAIQNKITQKAVTFLEDKIGTKVALDGIYIGFPKNIVLEGVYFEDQEGDTLLYAGKLAINTDLWALTRNEIQLNNIQLENTVAFVDREQRDSTFNFTYILDAFADTTTVADTVNQTEWEFSLHALTLENIRLRFDDRLTGNLAELSLGEFELEMNEFDLNNNRYGVEEILLANTRGKFTQTQVPVSTPASEAKEDSAAALVLSLDGLELDNVHLLYEQVPLGQSMKLEVGELELDPEKIDLENQEITINTFLLHNSLIAYHQKPSDVVLEENDSTARERGSDKAQDGWKVALNHLDLSGNSLQYFDSRETHQEGMLDPDHLWITNLTVDVRDIRYAPENMRADLRELSFQEQSGFAIKSFQAHIDVSEKEALIENFLLETGNSRMQLDASAQYPSFRNIKETYPKARVTSDINESYIDLRDILYLQPALLDSLPISLPQDTRIRFDAAVSGAVNNLNIRHLVLSMLSQTTLQASGRISGLPEPKDLRMDLAVDKFYTTRSDVNTLLPDTLLPDSIQLPAWVNVEASFRGSLEKGDFNTLLTSDVGKIGLQGNMNLDSASALRGINANLNVADLNVGDILGKPDSVMGTLTMQAEIKSNGLSPEEMNGTLTAMIESFDFRDYLYKDLKLDATLRDQVVTAKASMDDKNLDFTLDAGYTFRSEVPQYEATLDLRNADFEALNFSASPIRGRGTLLVNMETSDFKVLNGNVGIRKVAIYNGDELYTIDSLLFASIDQEGKSEIKIDSDLLAANFEGSFNIFSVADVMKEYFSTYYSLHDSLEVINTGRQYFSFNIDLKNTEILTGLLVPQLTALEPGEISGEFDSETRLLDLAVHIDRIQYSNIGIDSLTFRSTSDEQKLRYNFAVDKVMIDSMKIDGLEFTGIVANDSLRTQLHILDSDDSSKYVLAGTFFSREDDFELKLSPDIVLNYQNWSVPPENFILFGGEKLVAQDVVLTNLREKIIFESDAQPGTPIFIGFRELNLEYLTSMVAEEGLVSGLLEGDINLYPDSAASTFTSDITVKDFQIRDVPWGNLALQVEQASANRFDVDFGLTGQRNNVRADGYYQGGDAPAIDLTAVISEFALPSLQPLLSGQLRDLTGTLTGRLRVQGTPEDPDVAGKLLFKDAEFFSTYLNTAFIIDEETIAFNDEGIRFNAFEIADQNQNKARLDGKILTTNYRDFRFNLDLVADDFRLFDTKEGDNELFYGRIDIQANARIRGDMTTPVVNMNIGLTEGSDLTYIVPQSEAAVLETEGIVKFVDKTFEGDEFVESLEKEAADTLKSTFRGIDFTARIELNDQETFTVIIDPVTGDQLTVRGNSTLTLKVDPSGDIQLSGRYEISEGTYNLTFYKFVKREFDIESGSTITWSGDPLNAEMDISAIYRVETAPIELFSNQLTGSDASEVNRYRQRLPFLVYLNITGELLQPEIAFELEMPMDERNVFGGNVYARIQDINTRESDLNKQVFALLILKRFISDNPFDNQSGGGFESTARSSVSKILSEQLNRLSENIKGVELSFDIKSYEDYSSGQAEGKTELQLGVSKSLLNDRLVVKLSGNIDVEGQGGNREATDYIGDLALEYKLTPDGRFRITGFRNSNYDMIDGELAETGVGLIYVKDYNSLSELFKSNAETQN